MVAKRIIACLDVFKGKVVKGQKFKNHQVVGDIVEMAQDYSEQGIDELVFYDIAASADGLKVEENWVKKVASVINIPFSVAGGIDSLEKAESVLRSGADKISINTPVLRNPQLISNFSNEFGKQCVVVGVDSFFDGKDYRVYQMTGRESTSNQARSSTLEWVKEVCERGAGEIVLNCMNQDGVRKGYDIGHTKDVSQSVSIPVIASGGAGSILDFQELFENTKATGALAASIFHKKLISIDEIKQELKKNNIRVRL